MNPRRLVAGEAEMADFACRLGGDRGLVCAAGREDARRVVRAQDLVKLPEVEVIGAQAPERLVELLRRRRAVAPSRPSTFVMRKTLSR